MKRIGCTGTRPFSMDIITFSLTLRNIDYQGYVTNAYFTTIVLIKFLNIEKKNILLKGSSTKT